MKKFRSKFELVEGSKIEYAYEKLKDLNPDIYIIAGLNLDSDEWLVASNIKNIDDLKKAFKDMETMSRIN